MSLFRTEAVEAKRRRLWGEVHLAHSPSSLVWTAVLTFVCATILAALWFGTYTRKETVNGFLAPEAGIVQVRAAQNGRVIRLFVREGQSVEKGAPLVEFASDLASATEGPALDRQLAELDRQSASLDARQAAVERSHEGDRRRYLEQVSALGRLRAILVSQQAVQADALALAEADAERFASLSARGHAPAVEVDRRRRAVLAERAAAAELLTRLSEAEGRIADVQASIGALPARLAESLAVLESERAALAQRRSALEITRGYVLTAPVDGVVSAVQARVGMTPSADLPLLAIAPSGSTLEAYLLVPTRAVGFLQEGQEARLRIDAFPYQQYGFVPGQVRAISRTVLRPGEVPFPIEQKEPVYEIRVALAATGVPGEGMNHPLRAGMSLRADIPIDRRRLWQQLFSPLLSVRPRAATAGER